MKKKSFVKVFDLFLINFSIKNRQKSAHIQVPVKDHKTYREELSTHKYVFTSFFVA